MSVQSMPLGFRPVAVKAPVAAVKVDPWGPVVAEYLAAQDERTALKTALERNASYVALGDVEKRLDDLRKALKAAVEGAGGEGAVVATSEGTVTLKGVDVRAHRRLTVVVSR